MKRVFGMVFPWLTVALLLAVGLLFFRPVFMKVEHSTKKPDPIFEARMRRVLQRADEGRFAENQGNLHEAEAIYREVLGEIPYHPAGFRLVGILDRQGRAKEAHVLMKNLVKPTSRNGSSIAMEPATLVQYAELSRKVGDESEVRWALSRFGAKGWHDAYHRAAENARVREDHRLEIDFYEKALELDPNDQEAKKMIERATKDLAARAREP